MPEHLPVKLRVYCLGYAALYAYVRSSSAVSDEAQTANRSATAIVKSAEKSQTLFGKKAAAISDLRAVAMDCADDDWDGYGARAIDTVALLNAEAFVRVLPENFPLPEFAPEPDGSISLDWIQSRQRLFSVSVSSSNRLAYAWVDGTDTGHAVARFDGLTVPARVLDAIESIVSHENATVRVA